VAPCCALLFVTPAGYVFVVRLVINMVDNCDRVIALWDGDGVGGTAGTIVYARNMNKPIDNLWDKWKELS
jgi:hypothetical protein